MAETSDPFPGVRRASNESLEELRKMNEGLTVPVPAAGAPPSEGHKRKVPPHNPPESVIATAIAAVQKAYGDPEEVLPKKVLHAFIIYVLPAAMELAGQTADRRLRVKKYLITIINAGRTDIAPEEVPRFFKEVSRNWTDARSPQERVEAFKRQERQERVRRKLLRIAARTPAALVQPDRFDRLGVQLAQIWLARDPYRAIKVKELKRTYIGELINAEFLERAPLIERAVRLLGRTNQVNRILQALAEAAPEDVRSIDQIAGKVESNRATLSSLMSIHFEIHDAVHAYLSRDRVPENVLDEWVPKQARGRVNPVGTAAPQKPEIEEAEAPANSGRDYVPLDAALALEAEQILPLMRNARPYLPFTPTTYVARLGVALPDLNDLPGLLKKISRYSRTQDDADILNACDRLEKKWGNGPRPGPTEVLRAISQEMQLYVIPPIEERIQVSREVEDRVRDLVAGPAKRPAPKPAKAPQSDEDPAEVAARPARIDTFLQAMHITRPEERADILARYLRFFGDANQIEQIEKWWEHVAATGRVVLAVRLIAILQQCRDADDLLGRLKASIEPLHYPPLSAEELTAFNTRSKSAFYDANSLYGIENRMDEARTRYGDFESWDDMNHKMLLAAKEEWNLSNERQADIWISSLRARLPRPKKSSLDITPFIWVWNILWRGKDHDRRDRRRRRILPLPEEWALGLFASKVLVPLYQADQSMSWIIWTALAAVAVGALHLRKDRPPAEALTASYIAIGALTLWTIGFPVFGWGMLPVMYALQVAWNFRRNIKDSAAAGIAWLSAQGLRVWFAIPLIMFLTIQIERWQASRGFAALILPGLIAIELVTLFAARAPFFRKKFWFGGGLVSSLLSIGGSLFLFLVFPSIVGGQGYIFEWLLRFLPAPLRYILDPLLNRWGPSAALMYAGWSVGRHSGKYFPLVRRIFTLAGVYGALISLYALLVAILGRLNDRIDPTNPWEGIFLLLQSDLSFQIAASVVITVVAFALPQAFIIIRAHQDRTFWRNFMSRSS